MLPGRGFGDRLVAQGCMASWRERIACGAITGLVAKPSQRVVAAVMALDSGTLLFGMAFDLCEQAFRKGGPTLLVIGYLAGAFLFVFAQATVDERGRSARHLLLGPRLGSIA